MTNKKFYIAHRYAANSKLVSYIKIDSVDNYHFVFSTRLATAYDSREEASKWIRENDTTYCFGDPILSFYVAEA